MRRASLRAALRCCLRCRRRPHRRRRPSAPDPIETRHRFEFGPVGINPSLAMRDIGVDNNVFHDDDGSEVRLHLHGDAASRRPVQPEAPAPRRSRRRVDYVYFQTYDSERGTNRAAEIKANVDLGRLQPYASIAGVEHPRSATTARSTLAPGITIAPTPRARCCTWRPGP